MDNTTVFITGPTASGKTDLSLLMAQDIRNMCGRSCQIINVDVGQLYKPLSIGTAKPDWQHMPIPHHLFDVITEPGELDVVKYRAMFLDKVKEIQEAGDVPIAVGGSLFYVMSLLFPPKVQTATRVNRLDTSDKVDPQELWNKLHGIDPERAQAIDPHDTYRIQRALQIWESTGQKPSLYKPTYNAPFKSNIIFVNPPRDVLYDRINKRTELMVEQGWIDEAKSLMGTPWQNFLKQKKLIGYPEIFAWLDQGEKKESKKFLIETIQQKTRAYAKRQITFWKKFRKLLEAHKDSCEHEDSCEVEERTN